MFPETDARFTVKPPELRPSAIDLGATAPARVDEREAIAPERRRSSMPKRSSLS